MHHLDSKLGGTVNPKDKRLKVLFIAGSERSGSTLIGQILGQLPGIVHAGELVATRWWPRDLQSRLCGCGEAIGTCAFWRTVFERAFGSVETHPDYLRWPMQAGGRIRHLLMSSVGPGRAHVQRQLEGRLEPLFKFLESIQSMSGADVVIDSSKFSTYGLLLASTPGIDLHVLQIIRDPRAVAFSWKRKKFDPAGNREMAIRSNWRSIRPWLLTTPAAHLVWRSIPPSRRRTLRYEDFADRPQETLRPVLEMLDREETAMPFTKDGRVNLRPSHTLSGNPGRFSWSESIEIRPDNEWRSAMTTKDRLLVTLMTWPWLLRYRYPLRPRGHRSEESGSHRP